MFFDIFRDLCKQKGVSCKRAAAEIGLSGSTATKWKNTGATPNGKTLEKIAAYFDVSVEQLLGIKKDPAENISEERDELINLLEELKERPDMRMLFKSARDAKPEDVMTIARMLAGLKNSGDE